MSIIIAGIHTGIGKTVCSAILAEALGYDYWKPVQAGDLENSDSIIIKNHLSNPQCKIHDEIYQLKLAASPHWAAEQDGVEIKAEKLLLPESNNIIIETAGGIMSPLAKDFLNLDMIKLFNKPVILVSNCYLGSINHTLLSIQVLKQAGVSIIGVIFNGEQISSSIEYILAYSKLSLLLSVPKFETIDQKTISNFANIIPDNLKKKLLEFTGKG